MRLITRPLDPEIAHLTLIALLTLGADQVWVDEEDIALELCGDFDPAACCLSLESLRELLASHLVICSQSDPEGAVRWLLTENGRNAAAREVIALRPVLDGLAARFAS